MLPSLSFSSERVTSPRMECCSTFDACYEVVVLPIILINIIEHILLLKSHSSNSLISNKVDFAKLQKYLLLEFI